MSDSDTTDSDCGVRYKTTTTRHKHSSSAASSSSRNHAERSSYREEPHSSSRHSDRRRYRRSRSKSPDRRRHRRRSRSVDSPVRSRSKHYTSSRSSKNDKSPTKEPPVEKVLDISVSSVSSQDDQPEQQPCAANNHSGDCFGPTLPPALTKSSDKERKTLSEDNQDELVGPALPPHLRNSKSSEKDEPLNPEPRCIGPTLPPGFIASQASDNEHISSESELSPFSEPDEEEEEEHDIEDFIGPLPGTSSSRVNVELEQRALELKIRQIDEATASANGSGSSTIPKSREDWMLELPDIRKISDMGLGARQFRTREKLEIGDRSVWTDTPADRERKKKSTGSERSSKHSSDTATERVREREQSLIAKRDKEQEKMVKQHKKKHKRDKTLVEIHQTKLKKDKQASSDSSEPTRRPFDRNLDLHANRFDDAQKKAVMKKAQLLNSRFSSGSSKYL